MSKTITNGSDYIRIADNNGRERTILKQSVAQVTYASGKNQVRIELLSQANKYAPSWVLLDWAGVADPVTADVYSLYLLIEAYVESRAVRSGEVELTTGTNTISFSTPMPSVNYDVIPFDADGAGFSAAYDKTVNGYKVDALGDGTLIYHAISTT